jgi:hypothetical protein
MDTMMLLYKQSGIVWYLTPKHDKSAMVVVVGGDGSTGGIVDADCPILFAPLYG